MNSVEYDKSYEYDDEGYCFNYVMPLVDGDYGKTKYEMDERVLGILDSACKDVCDIMSKDYTVIIDIEKIKNEIKYKTLKL